MALFSSVKEIYDKVLAVNDVNIDNLVTKLHCRATTTILVCYSFLLSLGQVSVLAIRDSKLTCAFLLGMQSQNVF